MLTYKQSNASIINKKNSGLQAGEMCRVSDVSLVQAITVTTNDNH